MTTGVSTRLRWLILAVALTMLAMPGTIHSLAAQSTPGDDLPHLSIDALDPSQWSLSKIYAAPGQTITITNRGVLSHNFTIVEWGLRVPLPTLESVEIVVPPHLQPGDQFAFFCDEPGHREGGQQGVIVIVDVESAVANGTQREGLTKPGRVILETRDDFTWSPSSFTIAAGDFIEVRNSGEIEHHFVIDAWNINVTIPSGQAQLVQAPATLLAGETFLFYCSIPGHRALGMEGTVTISTATLDPTGSDLDTTGHSPAAEDSRFLPSESVLGDGWDQVRTGNARAMLSSDERVSLRIFPGEGQSAAYVGPAGSRVTIVVLPFVSSGIPANQIEDAILNIQLIMMADWDVDLRSGATLSQAPPPFGCDIATRQSGVTRMYKLPAGSTVCQLRSAGIAIFVAVEGDYDGVSGSDAADRLIARILQDV